MPKIRNRLTTRGTYTQSQLIDAINAVEGGMSIRAAGREFGIAESTIRLRMKTGNVESAVLGRKPTFTPGQEQELADHILMVANLYYGLTPLELRKIAYEFAERNSIPNTFCKTTKLAGKDWLALFMKRNPRVSLRKPEATSINRINAFNLESVKHFFSNLENVMEKYNFSKQRIYKVDETGISNVQKPVRILGPKGQKRVGTATSGERGRTVTAVCAVSASGHFIPPMFIFPRLRMSPQLEHGGPIGAVYACSKNGWINEDLFFEWVQHFSRNTKPTPTDPILLILDNHSSHISVKIYDYCRTNGITLLSLPPHTSHRLQPLDLTFFGPLKASFYKECTLALKAKNTSPNEAMRKISQYELAELFNRAYLKSATMDKGISGFSAAGISPLNPEKFTETDFNPVSNELVVSIDVAEEETGKTKEHDLSEPVAGISDSSPKSDSTKSHVRVVDISPVPNKVLSSNENKGRCKSRKQQSQILTGTPMKEKLEDTERKREINKRRKETKNQKENKNIGKKQRKACSRQLDLSESESDIEGVNEEELCDDDENDDIGPPNYDVCLVCDEFGRDNEMWYRCVGCGRWCHAECSGWDSPDGYLCDLCLRKSKQK